MTAAIFTTAFGKKIPERLHIAWLNMLLWGGSIALALEHVAHEEIVPYPPFLSAMESAADTATMLGEMATIGTAMLVGSVLVWAGMVFLYNRYSVETPTAQTA
ncbi:MAG: hypothetical protein A4E30_00958 [Methanomassiliicoccales archaeon PtaB.Bin215]|nr:MAG: hypothetical protein A4E30_00958 [Methanomassiliicoccales archaeon PtaB.Bin215]